MNANNLFEIPALMSFLPKLEGKTILDLGCGYGEVLFYASDDRINSHLLSFGHSESA